ncbi:glutamine-hydrolyzing GMP synthase [Candidatus Peregrinibacteria bacterium]|nr:glutamine-hydrolyzing GMP synthase [Candidatus Peregrinibacteria bacterium]
MDKIAILDFGGQYAHLIANRIRRLGVYSEIRDCDTAAEELKEYKGLILSGGPQSVYDEGAPKCDINIFNLGIPILGICYGLHIMIQSLGGKVMPGKIKEYGKTTLKVLNKQDIFEGLSDAETVWMSHGDEAAGLPEGFEKTASTEPCVNAGIANFAKKLYAIQFHPEVTHTINGNKILENFLNICDAKKEWNLDFFIEKEIAAIKDKVGNKKVFMLISGGVDSTVAYSLIQNAIGTKNTYGLFVDTGFIRLHEREEVEEAYKKASIENVHFFYAADKFFGALKEVYDPETKRKIIGDKFIEIQKIIADELKLNPEEWLLGQGTIYPDTIETGGTRHADKIKTHHNRVEQIRQLIEAGKIIEPLTQLYKDEVREVGTKLGLPDSIVWRHPFPGPGLAVRCLCADKIDYPENHEALEQEINDFIAKYKLTGKILPIKSVGVQGDARTYKHPFLLAMHKDTNRDWDMLETVSTEITNRFGSINRVLLKLHPRGIVSMNVKPGYLTKERIELLQRADFRVTQFIKYHKNYKDIWQFPTVLLPLSLNDKHGECIVLRPVNSEEAMTANFYRMQWKWVDELTEGFRELPEIDGVFYDITNKPPATIEWE